MASELQGLLARIDPEEPLLDHLEAVASLAEGFVRGLDPGLAWAARLAGLAHDLGKATPFFQDLLRGRRPKGDPLTRHSLLGALFAAWVAYGQGKEAWALPLFLAVQGHHGGLSTPWEALPLADLKGGRFPRQGGWKALEEKLQALKASPLFPPLVQALGLPDPRPFLEGEALGVALRLAQEADPLRLVGAEPLAHYPLALLYSALVDADRRVAAGYEARPRIPLPEGAVAAYLRAKPTPPSPLAPHRRRLFEGVGAALEAPLDRLFPARLTLSAPTGAGKTLAALRFALALRARVEGELGLRPRIVYALPYIAIADQVEEEIRGVLRAAGLPEEALLVHHHLALGRAAEEEVEDRLTLMETWDAEIILTTFVQVFAALLGPKATPLRHLHVLAQGSILILDEVQAIPAEKWGLVRALVEDLPGQVTVIGMTATQPGLVRGREIAPRLEAYPRRVRLQWSQARTLEALAQELAHAPPRSRLVVLNTVSEALRLYRLLKGAGLSHLYLLTGYFTPKDRRRRLAEVRRGLEEGLPITLVATQVVEAGVDLDFAEGYRAFGPMEALLQAAGRVNRGGRGEGRLWVLDLEGRSEHRIYGRILPERTREVLGSLLEEGVWDLEAYALLDRYYRLVEEGISAQGALEALEALATWDYDRLAGFSLLEERPSLPIFVEQDEEASRLLEELEEVLGLRDSRLRARRLRGLWPRLNLYTISPLVQRALKNLPPPLLGREAWRHVPRAGLEDYYDEEEGFRWEIDQFL